MNKSPFFLLLFTSFFVFNSASAQTFSHKAGPHGLMENGMQAVHTKTSIVYANPGEQIRLCRPDHRTYGGYLRWYDYDKDSAAVNIETTQNAKGNDFTYQMKSKWGWFRFAHGNAWYEIVYTMQDSVYRIARDQSTYKNYIWTTNKSDYAEPTLSKRVIHEFRPATEIAKKVVACTGEKYLEEYSIMAPVGRQLFIGPEYPFMDSLISNYNFTYHSVIHGNYYYNEASPERMIDKSKWIWTDNGVSTPVSELDSSLVATGQFIGVKGTTPEQRIYTLQYNTGTQIYNIAKFEVTFMAANMVGPLATLSGSDVASMELLYEQTFNYDQPDTRTQTWWSGVLDPDESTYGYYYWDLAEQRYANQADVYWGEYGIVNKHCGWWQVAKVFPDFYQHNDSVLDSTPTGPDNGKLGYMLYCDGSEIPGEVFSLKVNADLCPGSKMYFSAWLIDLSERVNVNNTTQQLASAPNMDFIVIGIDDEGGEHQLTTFTTGEFGYNVKNDAGKYGQLMKGGVWYQVLFPVEIERGKEYHTYRLKIMNKSRSSKGNDFALDDIRIYVQKPPVMPIQASTSDCIDKAHDTIRTYLRVDYQAIEHEGQPLYYQWCEGDKVIRTSYFNKDSASTTFGCVPILTTDEAIEASGLTSASLLSFDAAYRETKVPLYRYVKERVDATTERYVIYIAQPMEVRTNYAYTGFVSQQHDELGKREGCGTFADMLVAGGTRITINDDITLGDSVVSVCGHRSYTLNIVLTQIIRDETDPYDPLKIDTTHCRADWLIGDSVYVNAHPEIYRNSFDDIQRLLILYRGSSVPQPIKDSVDYLLRQGLLTLDTSSISMQAAVSLSYTAFPLAGSAGSKQVCTSPRFLHIKPAVPMSNMMAVGNKTEVLPEVVAGRPRIVRISDAQKRRGSFDLPLYLKGDPGEHYEVDSIYIVSSTCPRWRSIRLNSNKAIIDVVDTITLSGARLASLAAGYDYTFHIAFIGESADDKCDRGYTYFTLRIVPDVVTWLGGEWNQDANWSSFIPMEETDVVMLPNDYAVTFVNDAVESYDFNYTKNKCHHLYLPAGASMAGQEHVNINGQAFVDMPLNADRWTLTSVPLKGIVSGDMFVSQWEGSDPFTVATIRQIAGTDADDRYTYEVYNSEYDAEGDRWLVATNTLTRPMNPGDASMIGIDCAAGSPAPVIRLPKVDNMYRYYDGLAAKWLDESEFIVRDEDYGKPAFTGNTTFTLNEQYEGVYLFGNPTFGYIDIARLVADNADQLTGKYYYEPNGTTTAPSKWTETSFNHDVTTDAEPILLPPFRGILLEGKKAGEQLTIQVSSAMVAAPSSVAARKSALRTAPRAKQLDTHGGTATGAKSMLTISETSMQITEFFTPLVDVTVPNLHIERTLYKDGSFNTLCLPVSMSAAEIAASQLAGCQLYTFDHAVKLGDARLDVYMTETTAIEAGVPYLIKWDNTGEVLTDLTFNNVTITTDAGQTIGDGIQFVGNVCRAQMAYQDHDNLFVGAGDILLWLNTTNPLRGFRAYFQVPKTGFMSVRRGTPARLVLRRNVTTDADELLPNTQTTKKVVENGTLYILRDGKRYNVLGLTGMNIK